MGELLGLRKAYDALSVSRPALEYTFSWLEAHAPSDANEPPVLVHGDFRNGNFMVQPGHGLVSVLDWESAHLGNRYEDLGWICVRSWRFGNLDDGHVVGGFASLEDMCNAYEGVGGPAIDRAAVLWWALFGSLRWAYLCLFMGAGFRVDNSRLEHGVVGRRTSEAELDCMIMIAATQGGADVVLSRDMAAQISGPESVGFPSDVELLSGVIRHLQSDVVKSLMKAGDSRGAFMVRVAANALGMVSRSIADAPHMNSTEVRFLSGLMRISETDLLSLRREFCRRLRLGEVTLDAPGLFGHLLRQVSFQVLVDQPKYPSVNPLRSLL